MDYLARLYLSEDFPESLLGSIMGDFDGPQAVLLLRPAAMVAVMIREDWLGSNGNPESQAKLKRFLSMLTVFSAISRCPSSLG